MANITITTDNKWKFFSSISEVPEKVINDQFDYQNRDEVFDGFFKYRGVWYHTDMFMRIDHNEDMKDQEGHNWHGYHSDSAFSGVVIKISRSDNEKYMVGTYTS